MEYENALAGLASGMAGAPGGGGEMGGGEMMPCPLCGGTGMVSEDMLEGGGMAAIPPRLAARGGGMLMGGGGGAGRMSPPVSMGA